MIAAAADAEASAEAIAAAVGVADAAVGVPLRRVDSNAEEASRQATAEAEGAPAAPPPAESLASLGSPDLAAAAAFDGDGDDLSVLDALVPGVLDDGAAHE